MTSPRGRRWEAFARSVVEYYGGVCHICGHGGARTVDHLEPQTENPAAAWNFALCRPAHGAPGNACPQCSAAAGGKKIFCNQLRGMGSVDRARRIIAERIAEHAAPARDAGRPW